MKHVNRNRTLVVRLTESEYRQLKNRSGEMDLSKYVRQQMFVRQEDRVIPDRNVEAALRRLDGSINRIGVNINQIVHNHNSGYYTEQDRHYLMQCMEEIRAGVKAYRQILNRGNRKEG